MKWGNVWLHLFISVQLWKIRRSTNEKMERERERGIVYTKRERGEEGENAYTRNEFCKYTHQFRGVFVCVFSLYIFDYFFDFFLLLLRFLLPAYATNIRQQQHHHQHPSYAWLYWVLSICSAFTKSSSRRKKNLFQISFPTTDDVGGVFSFNHHRNFDCRFLTVFLCRTFFLYGPSHDYSFYV